MINKLLLIFSGILLSFSTPANKPADYLLMPTGQYGVAFQDIHWINPAICPDPNYSKVSGKNFSLDNKKHCHELMVRVYYPTHYKTHLGTFYYRPIVVSEQNTLKNNTALKLKEINQLSQLRSHTLENAPIVRNKQFPVILFIGGLGGQSQLYENLITQLVSNGYIVLGINSLFINGEIALPNHKVISPVIIKSWDAVSIQILPVLEGDISFVYKTIHEVSDSDVFKAMDLKHIAGVGHSFGGRAMANVANLHSNWFQALVTLDMEVHMGSFKPQSSVLPMMHIISAYWRSMFNWQRLQYSLNKNSYLVTLTPSEKDLHYSYHMDFTDLSTLQYLPAYQASMAYNQRKLAQGEDLIIKTRGEKVDTLSITRPLYLITKNANSWNIFYYEPGKNAVKISFEEIAGLQNALDKLPKTTLNKSELLPIKKIIHAYHQRFGNFLGKGDGLQITKSINRYLVDFFNTFLKARKNPFKDCMPLTDNTQIKCGPGVF